MLEDELRGRLVTRRAIMRMRQHTDSTWHLYYTAIGDTAMCYICPAADLEKMTYGRLDQILAAPPVRGEILRSE